MYEFDEGFNTQSPLGLQWFWEGLNMKAYTADFETTKDEDDCRVWAYAVCDIDEPSKYLVGNSIGGFMEWCRRHANCEVYFHNLAFDGSFILDYLEKHGWQWIGESVEAESLTYETLISDTNQFYCITLHFSRYFKVKIMDSLKIIPLSVKAIAKAYGLEEGKGELDYEAFREVGHRITADEEDYIRRDVQIVAHALRRHFEQGLRKMTAGSNALKGFKDTLGGHRRFRFSYPVLSEEEETLIRKAYKGGWTYVDKRIRGAEVGRGMVFDVNSLYPSVMYFERLPYGKAHFALDPSKMPADELWICSAMVSFELKPDHVPCIQLKGNSRFVPTEYLESSGGIVQMSFSNVDFELYSEQYDFKVHEWLGGYWFKSNDLQFRDYIDYWMGVKVKAGEEGNNGLRTLAKLMLNSLYGKFATRRTCVGKKPVLKDGVVRFEELPPEERDPVYLPVGVFITSYARMKTVSAAQACYDMFCYADTDSIHITGDVVPDFLDVDDFRLGAWKHESDFERAKFLRAKCYIEQEVGKDELTVHVSGMPAYVHSQVDFGNFEIGAVYHGKLYQRRVEGGIVLVEGDMQIRG